MPQTREHFQIARLLGIRRGLVAVTKCDRVAPELVSVTASDVADLTRGSFLEKAPILAVSARTGEGLPRLKEALLELAGSSDASEREARGVRLPVDRAFSVAGFGPVVTGSLVSGVVSRDQKLEILPSRRAVRVRRLEVHGRETGQARAGERVSANLAGVDLEELARGVVLAAPGTFATTSLLTARLELLSGAPRVKSGDRLSLHHFSAEAQALVRVLGERELLPGGSGRVQLKLSSPIAAVPGDRFVVRRLSPPETIGGGVVLDPLAPRLTGRVTAEARAALDRLEGPLSERLVLWIEQGREKGAGEEILASRAGVTPREVRAALAEALSAGRVHALRRSPDRYIAEISLASLAASATREIAAHLSKGEGTTGLPRGTLWARLLASAEPQWTEAVEKALLARGAYVIAEEEARLPGREELGGPERDLSLRIAEVFRKRGLDPPSPGEVAELLRHRPKVIEGLIGYLVKKGPLVRLPGGWVISREVVEEVARRLRASGKPSFDVGEFKAMFGLTRRLAIPLLEHLDSAKVTRRVGDRREILPGEERP